MTLTTRATKYVGFDVHQATTVAVVREESGRILAQQIVPTEAGALVTFVRAMGGTVHVALEEGTQAQWLVEVLRPVAARVVVCDRRGAHRAGSKGDQADAAALAELLRRDALRPVYHGDSAGATLRELARTYTTLVGDTTRVMLRLKALFRARGIPTRGPSVYRRDARATWLAQLTEPGARFRAAALYAELDVLMTLRPAARAALIAAGRRDPAWAVLRAIPWFGPVRVALLLATLQTPWRFRTKRQLWAYAGLAVVTRATAEYQWDHGRPVRRRRPPATRGLNRNHNRVVKAVLKGAALTASVRPGPWHDYYQRMLMTGMRPELARVTLARKFAAVLLRLWKTGATYDATQLSPSTP